jgi:ribosomal protein S8
MKRERKAASRYRDMKTEEIAVATAEFDREMVVSKSRPLTVAERRTWEAARRKPGRPKRGAGVRVISVSVERGLLTRSDALARSLGISRAALIERGLKHLLAEAS